MKLSYRNLLGDLVEVVEKEEKPNEWTYHLRLIDGKRGNYGFVDNRNNNIGGNELDFKFKISEGVQYVSFDIQASGHGHGTILLKAMFDKVLEFEQQKGASVAYVKGWLSSSHSNHHWKKSIPFYFNFPNTLDQSSPWKENIRVHIHLKDEKQPNMIGEKVDDISQFIRNGKDGYIVYHLCPRV